MLDSMMRNTVLLVLTLCVVLPTARAQEATPTPPPSSIPPNFSHYTLNPNPKPTTLGWATARIEEKLGRGVSALRTEAGGVYVGWRLLKEDPPDIAFNVYRSTAGGQAVRLNAEPITKTTDFLDAKAPPDREHAWWVRAVVGGSEQEPSVRATLAAGSPARQYRSFKIRDDIPVTSIDKIGVGDLDGDGEYDFVVKRPGGEIDPSFLTRHSPDTFKIEAYKSDGTFLWRRDLGWSIQLGIWFSPFHVADLDGDGKAEIAIKTGEGDPRDKNGQVLKGPEYLSIWDGMTGKDIDRTDWIPRGQLSDWGDYSGNRSNRHMLGVAYLDGKTPSVVIFRGTYGLMKAEAFYLKDKKLHKVWSWTNERAGWRYQGQGQHAIHFADLDGDGADEVLNGSIAIDSDGRMMWSTGMGHGDRFYVTDIDPARPGLEIWYSYEDPHPRNGVSLWDAQAPATSSSARTRRPPTIRSAARSSATSTRPIPAWKSGARSSSTPRRASGFPAPSRRSRGLCGGTQTPCASCTRSRAAAESAAPQPTPRPAPPLQDRTQHRAPHRAGDRARAPRVRAAPTSCGAARSRSGRGRC